MRKPIKLFILLILTSIILIACDGDDQQVNIRELHESFFREDDKSPNIDMSISTNIETTDESFNIFYDNKSDIEYTYTDEIYLECFHNDTWYVIPTKKDMPWNDNNYLLLAEDFFVEDFYISQYYHKLSPGKYRLVKVFEHDENSDTTFSLVEFKINK